MTRKAGLQRGAAASLLVKLRAFIVRSSLREGQPLRQDELAQRLGTSIVPLREALRELTGEGLVSFVPNRGFIIAELRADELRDLCETRILLETHLLRLAIPQLSERAIGAAENALDRSDADARFPSRWAEQNWEFHASLYAAADRPVMMKTVERTNRQMDRYLRAHVLLLDYRERGGAEHRRLLDACRRKDTVEAVAFLTDHIASAGALLTPYLLARDCAP